MCHSGQPSRQVARCGTYSRRDTVSLSVTDSDGSILSTPPTSQLGNSRTGWADSWLDADASPAARRALLSALSDLHVIAAWCCHDSCAPAAAHHHFSAAVLLATDLVTALVHLHLGALDLAESTAAA